MKCFISYAHKDHKLKEKFRSHLRPLEESYGLEIFDDKAIQPGENWEKRIWDEFEDSDLVIVLISANFIVSDFCYKREFKRAITKHQNHQVTIIPVILKECAWTSIKELANLQALPDEGRPISGGGFKTIDNGIVNAVNGIKKILLTRKNIKTKSGGQKPARPAQSKYKNTSYRAVFFDLDGTLVRGKVGHGSFRYSWQLVWSHLGFDDSIRKYHYQNYIDGVISYDKWCDITRDLFKQKGLSESHFYEIARKVRLTKNCKETLKILKDKGIVTVIVSGGIDSFLKAVFPDYRDYFDYVFINKFHYDPEGVLESIEKTPYDFNGKFEAIEYIRKKYGFKYSECVFVGEGRNDIYAARELSKREGLSIGYPSEHLQDYATHDLWKDRLDALLDIMFDI
jgi:HAD superfamily phosphoserine phosphatase-like hydrolase